MFGFFKSKEEKEIINIVSEIRQHRNILSFDGNIVEDFSKKVIKTYKSTFSIIEEIKVSGLLSDFNNSGFVVIAISKTEFMGIKYNPIEHVTKVQMGSSSLSMLENMLEGLSKFSKIGEKGHGMKYSNFHIINIIGAITVLGYEVGIPETEDGNYLPFKYNNYKFFIVNDNNDIWIVFEE